MAINKMQLLKMCRGFFLQTIIFTLISIGGCFYTYHFYNIFGLILVILGSLGILPLFFRNTYFIIDDISKINTDTFKGKIEWITASDILPYGVMITNLEKEREKSGKYQYWVRKCNVIS